MSMRKSSQASIILGALVVLATAGLLTSACDPATREMAVRMRLQRMFTMYPEIYNDIISGRLVPNRPGFQTNPNNQLTNPNGQFVNPNGQFVNPNGQFVNPNGQFVNPNGQFVNPNGQTNQGQTVLPNGQVVVPQNG